MSTPIDSYEDCVRGPIHIHQFCGPAPHTIMFQLTQTNNREPSDIYGMSGNYIGYIQVTPEELKQLLHIITQSHDS